MNVSTLIKIATYLAGNNEKLPVVYVAGKVSGLPYAEVFAKFKMQEFELVKHGFYVLNPLNHIDEHEEWQEAMKVSVILLACSANIFLLEDWPDSTRARLEVNLSFPLGINTIEI